MNGVILLIGKHVGVINKAHRFEGIVVDETQHTLLLKQGAKYRTFHKGSIKVELNEKVFEGNLFSGKIQDRI